MKGIVFVIFFLIGALLADAVWSHSWYDPKCCSTQDCRPVKAGEVERTPSGWRIRPLGTKIDEIINDGDSRIHASLDVNFHICVGSRVLCIYKPDPGT